VQGRQRPANVIQKKIERPVDGLMPGNDDIVIGAEIRTLRPGRERSFETAPDTISRDSVAEFFRDREAEARTGDGAGARRRRRGAFAHLNEERRRRLTSAAADSEKLGSRLEGWQNGNSSLQSRRNADSGAFGVRPG
jgi:hypothetical protein